jgi:hypothetical protein
MRKGLFLVLVLVVVLVLDVLGLCGKKGVRSVMILFDRSDRETSCVLEHEHEHERTA